MKHFKKPDGTIWGLEPDGSQDHLITDDMVPISDEALAILRTPSFAELKMQALTQARTQRQPIMGILDGMQTSSLFKADVTKATAIEAAKQGLKDLTKIDLSACKTADDFKAKIMLRYREIAAATPPDVRLAFAEALQ